MAVPTIYFYSTTDSQREGLSSGLSYLVMRGGDLTAASTVTYTVTGTGANAANAADFGGTLPTGVLTFAAGEDVKILQIRPTDDSQAEPDETFTVTLSNPTNAAIGAATVSGVILDDDAPGHNSTISVLSNGPSLAEGQSGVTLFTFTLQRTGDTSGIATVSYRVTVPPGGPGASVNAADFPSSILPTGQVTFGPGQTSASVTVNVAGDTTIEPDERFFFEIYNPVNAVIFAPIAAGFIINDDPGGGALPPLSLISLPNKAEGDSGTTILNFIVTRSGDLSGTSSVSYVVAGVGANPAAASDFVGGVLPSGLVTILPGENQKAFNIEVAGDVLFEPDETFTITLQDASGGTLVSTASTAQLTILNDDSASRPPTSASLDPIFAAILRASRTAGAALTPTMTLADGSTAPNPLYVAGQAAGSIAAQLVAGQITQAQAYAQMRHLADGSTSVSTLAYEFFTGKTPSQAGYDYLIYSSANANDLNDPYYVKFTTENRYINFSVNLGKLGEGATAFQQGYGGLSLSDALAKAYTAIFGAAPDAAKIDAILNGQVTFGGANHTRSEYFAAYGLDGLTGIGTKAAMVGWLLAEAVKADIGTYALANDKFLTDLFDGNASFNTDLLSTYAAVPAPDISLAGVLTSPAPDLAHG